MNKLLNAVILPAALVPLTGAQAEEIRINVQADQVVGQVSRHLTGACIEDVNHEIYGGIFSQMVFGESFQEPALSPSIKGFKAYGGRWVVRDDALRISGLDGPKLVSERGAFKDGAVGGEKAIRTQEGVRRSPFSYR